MFLVLGGKVDPRILAALRGLFSRGPTLQELEAVQAMGPGRPPDPRLLMARQGTINRHDVVQSPFVQDTLPSLVGGSTPIHITEKGSGFRGGSINPINHHINVYPLMEGRPEERIEYVLAHEFGHLGHFRNKHPEAYQVLVDRWNRFKEEGKAMNRYHGSHFLEFTAEGFAGALQTIRDINSVLSSENVDSREVGSRARSIIDHHITRSGPAVDVFLNELIKHEFYKDSPAAEALRKASAERAAHESRRGPTAR